MRPRGGVANGCRRLGLVHLSAPCAGPVADMLVLVGLTAGPAACEWVMLLFRLPREWRRVVFVVSPLRLYLPGLMLRFIYCLCRTLGEGV